MQTFAIAGVGLIGGSMGLALRKAGFQGEILGVNSPGAIEQAVKLGAIDRGVSICRSRGDGGRSLSCAARLRHHRYSRPPCRHCFVGVAL